MDSEDLHSSLFAAIVGDDAKATKKLLQADAGLASRPVSKAQFFDSRIFHWIYIGDTALHLAAAGYRVEIVRLLLAAGANPNAIQNSRKSSPLHYAADGFITGPAWHEKKQVETMRCLVRAGADIDLQDMNGATPLHRAVRTRCAATVKFLLAVGSDPMIKNKSGSTAFHLAVQNTGRGGTGAPAAIRAQQEIIQEFLSLGVSSKVKNSRGKSVEDSVQTAWIRKVLIESAV